MMLAICFSGTSCAKKSTYRTSGKPYINDEPSGPMGTITYKTIENQTDHFIAYKNNKGEVMLYVMRRGSPSPYSPDGLCDVKPGKAYKITYDAQLHWGYPGIITEYYFLTVYDCEECSCDELFEKGFNWHIDRDYDLGFPIRGNEDGYHYIAFKGDHGGYDMFTEKFGKVYYDEKRKVVFTEETSNGPIEMQFNVFCKKDLSDDYIIERIINGEYRNDPKFIYIDCCHDGDVGSERGNTYDSIKRFATEDGFDENSFRLFADEKPGVGKRLISYEEMSTLSREELGLEKNVYEWVYMGWLDRDKGRISKYNQSGGPARKCDVLLFSGEFDNLSFISYDEHFNIYVDSIKTDYEYENNFTSQYYAVFIRTEFNDVFPQE